MTRFQTWWCASGAIFLAVAACGGAPTITSSPAGTAATPSTANDERGMDVRAVPAVAPPEAPPITSPTSGTPFVLEARLRVRRRAGDRTITLDDVHSGDTVMNGDRLQLSVRTAIDGYLYLAFCSQHAKDPRYHGLSVFPEEGGIQAIGNQFTIAPARAAEIVLDDHPGKETLYLIVSRIDLSRADAGLATVLAAARQSRDKADCGPPLRDAVAGPRKAVAARPWSGGKRASSEPRPPSGAASGPPSAPSTSSRAADAVPRIPTPERVASADVSEPNVQIERGGSIVWNADQQSGVEADADGIVILRYELNHVSARSGSGHE